KYGSRVVEVDAFPISVDFAQWDALGHEAEGAAAVLRDELGVDSVLLGIDRLDYTKGITQRLQAFDELLDEGRVDSKRCTFVQVAVPSRSDVQAYQDERSEVEALVERINSLHRRQNGTGPVKYIESSFDDNGLAAWYRAANALVVTSLADGMNLVAKEFVAARGDVDGVVVLSEFAGAAQDLDGALIINPYDIDAIKKALLSSLELPHVERTARMESMRDTVRRNDVHHWARQFLERLEATPHSPERPTLWGLPVISRLAVRKPPKRA
ncbi:MAG: trehalose-6-phosphate synthase, partial [Acidimicrobiales bacterium]|nr:trehalose-6-phosphate synthase [Acidimicrobiales bacterium]